MVAETFLPPISQATSQDMCVLTSFVSLLDALFQKLHSVYIFVYWGATQYTDRCKCSYDAMNSRSMMGTCTKLRVKFQTGPRLAKR